MTDWISKHRTSIQFVVWTVLGTFLVFLGAGTGEPGILAIGAGALGLPGFQSAVKNDS